MASAAEQLAANFNFSSFGKATELRQRIFFTLGGLKVDELRGNVMRDDGTPIAGLYAAGRAAMGLPSNGYISGMSIADGIFTGRRAGKDASVRRQDRVTA